MTSAGDGDVSHGEAKSPANWRKQPLGWPAKSPMTTGESEKAAETCRRIYRAHDSRWEQGREKEERETGVKWGF